MRPVLERIWKLCMRHGGKPLLLQALDGGTCSRWRHALQMEAHSPSVPRLRRVSVRACLEGTPLQLDPPALWRTRLRMESPAISDASFGSTSIGRVILSKMKGG